ncbi:MAG TPA: ABC transporter permease, partial [Burkholderiaceae bacterium]
MSNLTDSPEAADGRPSSGGAPPAPGATPHLSPGRRAWKRFRRNRLGFYSLVLFSLMVVLSLFAEVLSND